MGSISNHNLDYREMFDVAKEFSDTASRAAGNHDLETQGWTRPRIIPEIVNRAFSCEVFLKSLIVFSGIAFRKEHELKVLWELLPIELQDEISTQLLQLAEDTLIYEPHVLHVSRSKLNLWALKILDDLYGTDALRALCAINNRKNKWGFYTLYSYMRHIEKYLKL